MISSVNKDQADLDVRKCQIILLMHTVLPEKLLIMPMVIKNFIIKVIIMSQ